MPRPKQQYPTPGELEVLKILWDRGPATVREVMEVLNRRRRRAYTSVMSLLEVMTEKRLLKRRPAGRAFLYTPAVDQERTLARIVEDVVGRVFEGSAAALVAHLLGRLDTTPEELDQIQQLIDQHQSQGKNP